MHAHTRAAKMVRRLLCSMGKTKGRANKRRADREVLTGSRRGCSRNGAVQATQGAAQAENRAGRTLITSP